MQSHGSNLTPSRNLSQNTTFPVEENAKSDISSDAGANNKIKQKIKFSLYNQKVKRPKSKE